MKITEPESAAPKWMEYVPIQSARQLSSILVCYSIASGLLFLLFRDDTDPGVLASLCLGAAVGSLPALVFALPQTFRIELTAPGYVEPMLERIDESLRFRGYRIAKTASPPPSPSATRYVSKLPPILSWRENEFLIRQDGLMVTVRGPRSSIGWLRKRLATRR